MNLKFLNYFNFPYINIMNFAGALLLSRLYGSAHIRFSILCFCSCESVRITTWAGSWLSISASNSPRRRSIFSAAHLSNSTCLRSIRYLTSNPICFIFWIIYQYIRSLLLFLIIRLPCLVIDNDIDIDRKLEHTQP